MDGFVSNGGVKVSVAEKATCENTKPAKNRLLFHGISSTNVGGGGNGGEKVEGHAGADKDGRWRTMPVAATAKGSSTTFAA